MTYSHIYIDDWTGDPSSFLNSSDWTRLINWIQNKPDSQAPPSSKDDDTSYNHMYVKNWTYPTETFTNITINQDWIKFLNWIREVPSSERPPTLGTIISGKATFEYVPIKDTGGDKGLDFTQSSPRPIRHAKVELLNANNTLVATGTTDNNGDYEFTGLENGNYSIKVLAESTLSYVDKMIVRNYPSSNITYSKSSSTISISTPTNTVIDIHANSGWGSSSYTSEREAGPFAILDTGTQCCEVFYEARPTEIAANPFPTLHFNWDKDTEGSYYTANNIYLVGEAGGDTDEYDYNIVVHEWVHYFENNKSRSDSLGGQHGFNDRLDIRIAFGEGFATGLSGLIGSRYYIDTAGSDYLGWYNDIESASEQTPGWFNETTIFKLIYDLCDGPNAININTFNNNQDTYSDPINIEIGKIYDVLIADEYKNSPAFTSIFLFLKVLKDQNPALSQTITNFVSSTYNINGTDEWGSGETNNAQGHSKGELLFPIQPYEPLYKELTSGIPVTVSINSIEYYSYNKQNNHRYIKFVGNGSSADLSATSSNSQNSWRVKVFKNGSNIRNITTSSNSTSFITDNNQIYVLDVTDTNEGTETYQITVTLTSGTPPAPNFDTILRLKVQTDSWPNETTIKLYKMIDLAGASTISNGTKVFENANSLTANTETDIDFVYEPSIASNYLAAGRYFVSVTDSYGDGDAKCYVYLPDGNGYFTKIYSSSVENDSSHTANEEVFGPSFWLTNFTTEKNALESMNETDKELYTNVVTDVSFQDLEGGFYGLTTTNGNEKLLPINLQDELRNNPSITTVTISGYTDPNMVGIHMWGKYIYITSSDLP